MCRHLSALYALACALLIDASLDITISICRHHSGGVCDEEATLICTCWPEISPTESEPVPPSAPPPERGLNDTIASDPSHNIPWLRLHR